MNVIHCNKCGIFPLMRKTTKFFITNCAHMFCESCIGDDTCSICKNQCNKLLISEEMPPMIKQMLSVDPVEQFEQCKSALEFQMDHYLKRMAFATEVVIKYENLKVSHLKLIEEFKKMKKKLVDELKKRDSEIKEWKSRIPVREKQAVLRNMVDSGAQSRLKLSFDNQKLSVVTPRKASPLFRTPASMSPSHSSNPRRYSVTPRRSSPLFRTPASMSPSHRYDPRRYSDSRNSAQLTDSSVENIITPASDLTNPSPSQPLLRFSGHQNNGTNRSPFTTPDLPLQTLKIGSWHASKPRKPF